MLPDPQNYSSIGWVCVSLVAIIVGLRHVLGFLRDVKDKPAPADVQRESAEKFATKAELDKHLSWDLAEHEKLWRKLGGVERDNNERFERQLEDLRSERRQDMQTLQQKIEAIGHNTSALQATNTLQNQRLTTIETDVKRILENMPRKL